MKKAICSLIVCVIITSISIQAHAGSASASIDHNCKLTRGSFVIPPGQTATKLSVTLNSSWLPCQGVSTPQRIGARIVGPAGNTVYYGVKYYNNKSETLAGNLVGLTLGPGAYTFEVPDGGKQTSASVSFVLKKGKAPPAPAAATVPGGWGTIAGQWTDPAVGSKAKITQNGNSMSIINSFNWNGAQVVWTGNGTVSGNKVTFAYKYLKNKPEFWENGTMTLTRTSKNKLVGKWVAYSGKYSQAITFIQTKSDDPKKPSATQAPVAKQKVQKKNKMPAIPTATQKNPCPAGYHHHGSGECRPNTIPKVER
ncbi:MAG: hypothetical protein HN337_03535 [Deltaproteobacteria bacterium]|jgi:hypothetical protein|nr:hypothetical protein [Deltaproteobacteria bacterium]